MPPLRLASLDDDLRNSYAALRADLERPDGRLGQSRRRVKVALQDGRAHYGLNTGFGALKSHRIEAADAAQLQVNLIRSHAVGVGEPVAPHLSRRMVALKAHALGHGFSGVSLHVVAALLDWLDAGLAPVVPSQGSLGASGDLAPLAHLALPLIGEGEMWRDGERVPAADALEGAGLGTVTLGAKDGLALINGTQFMQALGLEALLRARSLGRLATIVAAMTLEAIRGSYRPFDIGLMHVRPHPGGIGVAGLVRKLVEGSEIGPSHEGCDKVQDPYSVRCVPAVHGASLDAFRYVAAAFETELGSVTDNPVVGGRVDAPDLISGGHFHGQPLAIPLDTLAIATAELASISERRSYLLLDGHDALPPFLVAKPGLSSGFMMTQYTAAALVSENKTLCHPASVDTIPSSRGQEDHVSMGAWGARKALRVVENAEHVLAVELLCAAQALDFRLPLRPGRGVRAAWECVREVVPFRKTDGVFTDDLDAAVSLVRSGRLAAAVAER